MAPKQWHFPNFRATLMIGKGLAENGLAPGLGRRVGGGSGGDLHTRFSINLRVKTNFAQERAGHRVALGEGIGWVLAFAPEASF